ncbi:MAG TPA: isochorismatase family protein [Opitutaceae bacterium]|nr:isochorismatase family protein [Opitutaceae bacterium]
MTGRPTNTDTLLLCVDMQPVFLRAIADAARVQRRCEFAIAAATGLGLPVAFTEQVPKKLGPTAPELLVLAPGAAVFAKDTFSALADDTVRDGLLRARGVEHVLLCGIETPVCIYQTTIDALAAGIQITLLSDCLGARRSEDAASCLAELTRAGAHVLPSETVFYSMLRDVKHPFFKAYTQLVKTHG